MQLYVKLILVRPGTSQPLGDPRLMPCPPDVEPDNLLSFLTHMFGEPIDTAWTSTGRHPRIATGWVFPGLPATGTDPAAEFICVPLIRADDGTLQSMFELQADQRQDFERLAAGGALDSYTVIGTPQRDYQPPDSGASEARGHGAIPADGGQQAADLGQLHRTLTQIARETGAALHAYPRPGRAIRRILLRDTRDGRGTQFEAAQIEDDGTLRIIGRDQGPGVTEFFGEGITSYEWIYTVAPNRVGTLLTLTGGQPGQDPLDALAACYHHTGGHISDILKDPKIGADLSNWHS